MSSPTERTERSSSISGRARTTSAASSTPPSSNETSRRRIGQAGPKSRSIRYTPRSCNAEARAVPPRARERYCDSDDPCDVCLPRDDTQKRDTPGRQTTPPVVCAGTLVASGQVKRSALHGNRRLLLRGERQSTGHLLAAGSTQPWQAPLFRNPERQASSSCPGGCCPGRGPRVSSRGGDSRCHSAARPALRKRCSQCRSCRILKPAGATSGRLGLSLGTKLSSQTGSCRHCCFAAEAVISRGRTRRLLPDSWGHANATLGVAAPSP